MIAASEPVVVKVGGSLLPLADLGQRLERYLKLRAGPRAIVVPGGGRMVRILRRWERVHSLGEGLCHRMALEVMGLNAALLRHVLSNSDPSPCSDLSELEAVWRSCGLPVIDFGRASNFGIDKLPQDWSVSSDSLAATVGKQCGAARLVLLKSVTVPHGTTPVEAARAGYVDTYFPKALMAFPAAPVVEVLNLRRWPMDPHEQVTTLSA